ncbi:MAG: hypothetical protein HOO04_10095 [Phycisphaerae bacterium]|nr:hypothetical protein [Phycisphaerae bacterium]
MMSHTNQSNRRGVSSVLAMIFMALVASLTAVMAIVSEGNVRSAESAVRVSRSLSAAESGLQAAAWRLGRESSRFIVEAGSLADGFGDRLWRGTWVAADGTIDTQPVDGYEVPVASGTGVMHAIFDAHVWHDSHGVVLEDGVAVEPVLDEIAGIVYSQGIAIHEGNISPWFQLKYEMLADGSGVRVTSRGMFDDVQRLVQMDFMLEKRIEYAVIGQSRIMIGKNVLVDGPIGALYGTVVGELSPENGDPLVLRSDFYDLDTVTLDPLLDSLHAIVQTGDADGDGRMRPSHASEGVALGANPALQDHDGDQYVDDFDLFLGVFDTDEDDQVVYDPAMAQAAGYGAMIDEFSVDDDLAEMLDGANPDRNQDGVVNSLDMAMGYNDGVLDSRDRYAKIRGHLSFAVDAASWESARSASWQSRAEGVIRPSQSRAPSTFGVADPQLVSLTSDMFLTSTTWYEDKANAAIPFSTQVTTNGGWGGETTDPEAVPWGSVGAYDIFDRPVYRNMIFSDVKIPMGANALFVDCWFIGVAWIETTEACTNDDWNYVGARELGPGGVPQLRFPEMTVDINGTTYSDTTPFSNNLRFDGCTFLGTLAGDRPLEYTHWRNKVQLTGNTRFFIDPEDEDMLAEPDAAVLQGLLLAMPEANREEMAKTSMMLPGWSVDVGNFDSDTTTKVKLSGTIVTGLIDVRGSADIHGTLLTTFRPVESQGPLAYGGTPDAFNTTLGYFGNDDGDMEGVDVNDPGFGGFGQITIRYDEDAKLPDGIPWPLQTSPQSVTWYEGGTW